MEDYLEAEFVTSLFSRMSIDRHKKGRSVSVEEDFMNFTFQQNELDEHKLTPFVKALSPDSSFDMEKKDIEDVFNVKKESLDDLFPGDLDMEEKQLTPISNDHDSELDKIYQRDFSEFPPGYLSESESSEEEQEETLNQMVFQFDLGLEPQNKLLKLESDKENNLNLSTENIKKFGEICMSPKPIKPATQSITGKVSSVGKTPKPEKSTFGMRTRSSNRTNKDQFARFCRDPYSISEEKPRKAHKKRDKRKRAVNVSKESPVNKEVELTKEELFEPDRRAKILARYLEKRQQRVWTKRIRYPVRKQFADSRMRVKGRFISKDDNKKILHGLFLFL